MRNKVRKSLAFLLALALVVSVMSGLGLSVSAEQESNTPGTEEVQQQDKTDDTYTVVETNEDYTPSINNDGVTVDGATATGDMTIDKTSAAKTVAYTNERNASTPGGVIMTIAPYALMVVLAGAFAVVFLTRRNRAE